jgi:cation diffusion facilitator family transporter
MQISPSLRYTKIKRVLLVILVLNWAVALAKILFGITSRCASMTADGFHSLADGASNIIGLIGISLASQPVDADHPYGHKKYETFFSLGIAALLFIVSFNLFREGITRFFTPAVALVDGRSFSVMLITLAINFLVTRYELKKGKLLKSDILISDATHTKADILTSISVIVTLVLIKLGFPKADSVTTAIIAIFIARAGFNIIKESSRVLCDTEAIAAKKIATVVLSVQGVQNCHKIRTRGRPDDIHVDLHVQVDPQMHMDVAHKISYAIEDALKKEISEITDVVVHMEPLSKTKPATK